MLAMVPTSRPEFEGGLRRRFGDGGPQDRAWSQRRGQVLTPLLDPAAAQSSVYRVFWPLFHAKRRGPAA